MASLITTVLALIIIPSFLFLIYVIYHLCTEDDIIGISAQKLLDRYEGQGLKNRFSQNAGN